MTTATEERIRVAYVVHTFDMGGLEHCIARLVNHLDPLRFSPIVICLNRNGDAANWVERADIPIIELHKREGNDPRVVWRLAKALREYQVDLVHSHNWGTLLETVLARRWVRVPTHVHAEHGLELADLQIGSWRRRLRSRVARWALDRVDAVVAVAGGVRDRLRSQLGYPAENVQLIANGVDPMANAASEAEGVQIRRSLGIPESAYVVGSVGRLAPVKDFGTAIEALALVVGKRVNVHLVLVGNGPELESLTGRAEAAGVVRNVHFAGQQTNVGDWLAAMDLYMNCSLSEGMSLSILEAMSAGRPLVVTDVGENAALVNGAEPCGVVVPAARPAALANAIYELSCDRRRRIEMGRVAKRRHAELYSVPRMVQSYEKLYLESHRGHLNHHSSTLSATACR